MKITHRQSFMAAAVACAIAFTTTVAQAGEIGHYAPGVANIRDFTIPKKGA